MSLHALIERWRKDADVRIANAQNNNWALLVRENEAGRATAMLRCADELAAALSGGGEAVAMRFKLPGSSLWSYDTNITEIDRLVKYGWTVEFLFSHPSAVTDEMVKLATAAFFSSDECQPPLEHEYECMRAALTAALSPGGSRECG